MSNITGKIVLITGASSGIGEATARLLAAQGATVVLGARRLDRLEKLVAEIDESGGIAACRALDVTSREDTQAFVDFAEQRFSRVDVIVNNAGVMPLSPLDALKVDEWNRMIDVNIRGVLHGIAAALPVMQAQGNGQIINVASTAGHRVWPSAAVYCATKAAIGGGVGAAGGSVIGNSLGGSTGSAIGAGLGGAAGGAVGNNLGDDGGKAHSGGGHKHNKYKHKKRHH